MSIIDEIKPKVAEALASALGEALDCTRSWDAWNVGTMTADDFELVTEDADRMDEIVEAVLAPIRAIEYDLTKKHAEKTGMEMGRCCHGRRMDIDCPDCEDMNASTAQS